MAARVRISRLWGSNRTSRNSKGGSISEEVFTCTRIPPRAANLILYLLTVWRPPRWLFDRLLRRVEASTAPQRLYPVLGLVLRLAYLSRRALNHLRFMDFSAIPGFTGFALSKTGVIRAWRRLFGRKFPRPNTAAQAMSSSV